MSPFGADPARAYTHLWATFESFDSFRATKPTPNNEREVLARVANVMPRRFGLVCTGLVVLLALGARPAASQESPCDQGLLALARGPHGYSLHGERCEGIYVQPVAGTVLWVASLTRAFESYDLTSGADLVVAWAAPQERGIRIRAQGIKHNLYYRMDAARPAAANVFHWPTDLLSAQNIRSADLGVLAWMRYPVGGAEQDVLVPLRISQRGAVPDTGAYDLVLFPMVALREVYLSVTALGPDGRSRRIITEGEPLRYGYYPPERPVHVVLRNLSDAGLYYIEIGAERTTGNPVTLRQWMYRPRGSDGQ